MGRPQFFSPAGLARTIAEAEASHSASRLRAARRNFLREEVDRLLPQARSEVRQNQPSNTSNPSPRMGSEPRAQPEPSLPAANYFGYSPEMDPLFQPVAPLYPATVASTTDPDTVLDMPNMYSFPNAFSSGPYGSGALQPVLARPPLGPRRPVEEDIALDALEHDFDVRSGERRRPRVRHRENGHTPLRFRASPLRGISPGTSYRARDSHFSAMLAAATASQPENPASGYAVTYPAERQQPVPPAVAPDNSNDLFVGPVVLPSLEFYPAGENRRPQDIINPQPQLSYFRRRSLRLIRDSSRPDIPDLEEPMVQHIEDIRRHRLPRYYELLGRYADNLFRWCLRTYEVRHMYAGVPRRNRSLQNPAAEQANIPHPDTVFSILRLSIGSRNADEIATAARGIQNCLEQWSDDDAPLLRGPVVGELAGLLLEEGMEEERMVWEPVMRLHTGADELNRGIITEWERINAAEDNDQPAPAEDYDEAGREILSESLSSLSSDESQAEALMDDLDNIATGLFSALG